MPQQTTVPQTGPTPSLDIIYRHHGKHATADPNPSDRATPSTDRIHRHHGKHATADPSHSDRCDRNVMCMCVMYMYVICMYMMCIYVMYMYVMCMYVMCMYMYETTKYTNLVLQLQLFDQNKDGKLQLSEMAK